MLLVLVRNDHLHWQQGVLWHIRAGAEKENLGSGQISVFRLRELFQPSLESRQSITQRCQSR